MNINRHNYEEFFLLYVDNELTEEQKEMVDAFVMQHPDLEEELTCLQQSKLIPEQIEMDGKESLFRNENSLITMENYEEWLVLYVDDELEPAERKVVEEFSEQNPAIKEEILLFQQTKAMPEEIVFPAKSTLYRREEKVRVIRMQWWKVAVAALFIIGAGLTTYSLLTNKSHPGTTLPIAKKAGNTNPVEKGPAIQQGGSETGSEQQLALTSPVKKQDKTTKENTTANRLTKEKENNHFPQSQQTETTPVIAANIPQPGNNTTVNTTPASNTGDATASLTTSANEPIINPDHVTNEAGQTSGKENGSTIGTKINPAVQFASNTDENRKLRGFFRKATRFIERTTKVNPANDDDKVLIGGMAVSLK